MAQNMSYEDSARQTLALLVDMSHTWGNPLSVLPFHCMPTFMPYPTSLSPSDSSAETLSHPLGDTVTPPLDAPAINTWSHSRSTSVSSTIAIARTVLLQTLDWQKSFPKLLSELNDLRAQVWQEDAELLSANAHCTIIQ